MATNELRRLYPLLGRLLAYPDRDFPKLVSRFRQSLSEHASGLCEDLEEFERRTETLSVRELQECYTRFFDLSPTCVPYLSVHLFGEENLKRSRLMVALREKYEEWNFDPGDELPDHLSPVLRSAPHFKEDEWREFLEYCVNPSLEKLRESLDRSNNPYSLLLKCLGSLTRAETLLEISHA